MLKWLRAEGCPLHAWACAGAALYRHLEVLKWLRENARPWDASAWFQAVSGGHLDGLKWLRNNKCPENAGASAKATSQGYLVAKVATGQWILGFLEFKGLSLINLISKQNGLRV